jgi:hypothetical protein
LPCLTGCHSDVIPYITPNLGRADLHEVDAATLYARVRPTGGKCRVCWKRIRQGEPGLRAGVRYRPRPGAEEAVHERATGTRLHARDVAAAAGISERRAYELLRAVRAEDRQP